uniref:Reverse transcriptase N-terminal domain-containing protein n=1 Tax=Agarophyton chilense TaxID=2510777 RepID=A0A141SEK2_AGACH|nr:hypothetical protein Gchil_060 [Agarophyton chilense]AMK96720.1 hypothetical protein Gchil_060 [Agarophyton chilense]ASP44615.1 hypothetical protein [Agarophyton chilense]UAD84351.1 hypothetical protein [Agarophyton chilense]
MTNYILDEQTKWKYLPWNKIKQRVDILKYRIYQASKVCNKHLIYKTQNNFVNSNEVKILAIQSTCRSIEHSYLHSNKENYNISDISKTYIFSHLFDGKSLYKINNSLQSLVSKIEQYMIYLCLESEWNARFRSVFCTNVFNTTSSKVENRNNIHNFNEHIVYNNYVADFKFYIPIKYINIKYIKKKSKHLHIFYLK